MPVDRCVCRGVTFEEVKALAEIVGPDFDELSERTRCGTGCGMCKPYILIMLLTGETCLPVMRPQVLRERLDALSSKRLERSAR